jgi:putative phosphoesterase
MRVAALYDIHGNLPALESVLSEVQREDVDRVVVGGDVFPGPMCRESLTRLLELPVPIDFIRGNCEVAVLAAREGRNPYALPEEVLATMQWYAERLSCEEEARLQSWPKTLRIDMPSRGAVLFCHGTPRDENEIFTKLTANERLQSVFQSVEAQVCVCGHTHMQFDRTIGEVRVVNAGSVGMPFGKPGAYWLLLDHGQIKFRRTDYDRPRAAERIRATGYPQANDFADRYILELPSEEKMLRAFDQT